MSNDLDAATLANYRREIERAAAQDERARAAVSHIFAALDRRDERTREMLEIVRAMSNYDDEIFEGLCQFCDQNICIDEGLGHAPDCPVTRARALLGGDK